MKSKYLLSSIAIHIALVLFLSPFVLSSPPKKKSAQEVAYVELEKVSQDMFKSKRLKKIVVTATKAVVQPLVQQSSKN